MTNVVKLADELNDNRFATPGDILEDALRDIATGSESSSRCIIITLDDADDCYNPHFYLANIKHSEVVALLATIQAYFIKSLLGE
jgi:hypothetical protein